MSTSPCHSQSTDSWSLFSPVGPDAHTREQLAFADPHGRDARHQVESPMAMIEQINLMVILDAYGLVLAPLDFSPT
jgi:hypothetical protein